MKAMNQICGHPESVRNPNYDPLTHALIGRAMEVHNELGPGLDEVFYHKLLGSKLCAAGVKHEFKPRTKLLYRGLLADVFEPDIVVPEGVVVELKAQRGGFSSENITQLLCYLKFWKIPIGLLLDFAKERLIFQRVIYSEPPITEIHEPDLPEFIADRAFVRTVFGLIKDIYDVHGLGYRDTTYWGLLMASLQAEQVPYCFQPIIPIGDLGQAQLPCLVIDDECVVTITALGEGTTAADRAATQNYLRLLRVRWGLTVHFGKRRVDFRFVHTAQDPASLRQPQI